MAHILYLYAVDKDWLWLWQVFRNVLCCQGSKSQSSLKCIWRLSKTPCLILNHQTLMTSLVNNYFKTLDTCLYAQVHLNFNCCSVWFLVSFYKCCPNYFVKVSGCVKDSTNNSGLAPFLPNYEDKYTSYGGTA